MLYGPSVHADVDDAVRSDQENPMMRELYTIFQGNILSKWDYKPRMGFNLFLLKI